jgi:hypothetical protein
VAPQRPVDRDNGMRRISSATRWLAGVGIALVAAFSLFFAERAASSTGSNTPAVNTPAATAPPATDGGSTSGSSSGSSAQPVETAPPVTYPPVRHTHSGGS